MKIGKILLILVIVAVLGFLTFLLINSKIKAPQEKPTVNKVGLWKDCNPQINNCETGLDCRRYGVADIYRCIKYLKEGDECGTNVAEICDEGLICTDTVKTRQRCGTFSTKGDQECFVESLQVCKTI